jgi:prophage regulatory protein
MTANPTIIRRRDVEARTGLSRSAIYARLKRNPKRPNDYDPTFPRPIQLGPRAVGWIAAEIDRWVAARAAERDWTPPAAPEPEPAPTERRTRRPKLGLPKAVPILDNGQ